MIMHPAIVALLAGSLLSSLMVLYAARYGIRILRHWDLDSGSERQLNLERKTYLISTVMSYVLAYQLGSLFLFIFTVDRLSPLLVGAMCAAGVLNANGYGYATLLLKIINFILGGVWLLVNYTDNQAIDYPLIKQKYLFLIIMAPLVMVEMGLQGGYFLNLDPHVITSCCGSIFSSEGVGVAAAFSAFPSVPMKFLFYGAMLLTGFFGITFYRQGKPWSGVAFSLAGLATFVISVAALISFISLYYYQLPTHHCPFCVLQREYGYVGYFLYLSLLGGVVASTAVGALIPARKIRTLKGVIRVLPRRATWVALGCYLVFTALATARMIFSDFKLEGY